MSAELIAIFAMFLTMIIGFLSFLFMLWQMNHQINSRIDRLDDKIGNEIKEVRDDIKATNARIDATNTKIDTLLLGLFRSYLPEQPQQKQDKQT